MKKSLHLFAIFLLLALLIACPAPAESNAPLQIGDVVGGFEVIETGALPLIGASTVTLEHQKTGAMAVILKNDDPNRLFNLSFVTPAESDMGVSHIFEHATLDGSAKYPSKSLFFNLSFQTYNTFMNAMTQDTVTTYPVASLSEAQLLRYADFYTDSCLHPMLADNPDIFLEEAWRYVLDDPEGELTIAGTVYSEMSGAYTIMEAAAGNILKTLFPGSYAGNCYGGRPSAIPQMTHQDLIDYHEKYYHPSNSLAVIYGDVEHPEAFLALLDGYFSEYDKKAFVRPTGDDYQPIEAGTIEKTLPFAADAYAYVDGGCVCSYGIVCENMDAADQAQLDTLAMLFAEYDSPIARRVRKDFPAAIFDCTLDLSGPEPAMLFTLSGVSDYDAPYFKAAVDNALEDFMKNGFDAEVLSALAAATRIETALIAENANVGVNLATTLSHYWSLSGDVNAYADVLGAIDAIEQSSREGVYQRLAEKYLRGERRALVTTAPRPGLKEQQQKRQAEKLADIKAGMSGDEIAALVQQTQELERFEQTDDSAQYIAQLQAVTVESLGEDVRLYDMTDETDAQGVRHIDVPVDTDGVGQVMLLIDVSHLTQDELMCCELCLDLMAFLETDAHDADELSMLTSRYLYNLTIAPIAIENDSPAGYTPYLCASWVCAEEDVAASYDLFYEILTGTRFESAEDVLYQLSNTYSALYSYIDFQSFLYQVYRAAGAFSPSYAYQDYLYGVNYAAFLDLTGASLSYGIKSKSVLDKLSAVQEKLAVREGAISVYIGSGEGMTANRTAADACLSRLNGEKGASQLASYDFPKIPAREGIAIDSDMNYNLIYAPIAELGLENGYTGDLDAVAALVSDMYLYPMLRDRYGAYGVMHEADETGMYIVTYADPNLQKTYDIYERLPEVVRNLSVDQDTLNGYILSACAANALPEGEISGAVTAVLDHLAGRDPARVVEWVRALKAVSTEDMARYAEVYQALIDRGVRSTSGSRSALEKNSDMFDSIIHPFE